MGLNFLSYVISLAREREGEGEREGGKERERERDCKVWMRMVNLPSNFSCVKHTRNEIALELHDVKGPATYLKLGRNGCKGSQLCKVHETAN